MAQGGDKHPSVVMRECALLLSRQGCSSNSEIASGGMLAPMCAPSITEAARMNAGKESNHSDPSRKVVVEVLARACVTRTAPRSI